MSTFNNKYKEIITEIQKSSRSEYDEFFDDFYQDKLSKADYDFLMYNSKGSEQMLGLKKFNVEKSDSGNIIVQWSEKDDIVYIIGILSRTGKVTRDDVDDMHEWLEKMSKALLDGKTIIASPNEVSILFINRLEKKIAALGKTMHKEQIGPEFDFKHGDPLFKWKSFKITVED